MLILYMKTLYIIFIVICAIFGTWLLMRLKENFTTNFDPDDQGMEQTIHGYAYQFGDKRGDLDTYFGFPDDLGAVFGKRLLPDIIPQDS
jgi:hypothetical protein